MRLQQWLQHLVRSEAAAPGSPVGFGAAAPGSQCTFGAAAPPGSRCSTWFTTWFALQHLVRSVRSPVGFGAASPPGSAPKHPCFCAEAASGYASPVIEFRLCLLESLPVIGFRLCLLFRLLSCGYAFCHASSWLEPVYRLLSSGYAFWHATYLVPVGVPVGKPTEYVRLWK